MIPAPIIQLLSIPSLVLVCALFFCDSVVFHRFTDNFGDVWYVLFYKRKSIMNDNSCAQPRGLSAIWNGAAASRESLKFLYNAYSPGEVLD